MQGKKVIVTGASGYVGSRVAVALHKQGVEVVAVDMVDAGVHGVPLPPDMEFRKHDLRVAGEADKALKGGADVVLHLAADIGSINYMHEHQAEIMTNNMLIDAMVYPALLKHNIPWIVYSSSSMVFQYPPKFPYTEEDIVHVKNPSNVYGFAKLAGEYFCRSYKEEYGLKYTILRYHNIYGPGEDSKGSSAGDIHVIPALLHKVFSGQYPLEFLGDPSATRSFTYVDDAVDVTTDIVMRALNRDKTVENEDFNIGHDYHLSIMELGRTIWKHFGDGREFKYTIVPTKADTALRREADISKLKNKLGWKPKVSLEEGLKPTAQWMKERNKS